MLSLKSPRRPRSLPAFVVQPAVPQVAVHRGSGQQAGGRLHQSFRSLDPVLDQQLDGAAGREVSVLQVRGTQLYRRDQLREIFPSPAAAACADARDRSGAAHRGTGEHRPRSIIAIDTPWR